MCESSGEMTSTWEFQSWLELAQEKRRASVTQGRPEYHAVLKRARHSVHGWRREEISVDLPRTFGSLPEVFQPTGKNRGTVSEQALGRLLIAATCVMSDPRGSAGEVADYGQGMSALAAVCLCCLGLAEEESAFWLFLRLLEDVLDTGYFAKWPRLLRYRSLAAQATPLVWNVCPQLARALGYELDDVVAMLCCKLFIPCFVGSLSADALIALWNDLFMNRQENAEFKKRPLLVWFAGVLASVEQQLLKKLRDECDDMPKGWMVVQTVLKYAKSLPQGWRPAMDNRCPKASVLAAATSHTAQNIIFEERDQHLAKTLSIPPELIARLHKEFKALPWKQGDGIGVATLRRILWKVAPRHVNEEEIGRLFSLIDRDGTGSLDLFELMTGLHVLCEGSRDTKLRHLFNLYDTTQSGYLDMHELERLGTALMKVTDDSVKFRHTWCMPSEQAVLDFDTPLPERCKVTKRASFHPGDAKSSSESSGFLKRLSLLDSNGDGRVSLDDFRLGMCDATVGKTIEHVSLGLTSETEHRVAPHTLRLTEAWTRSTLEEPEEQQLKRCTESFRGCFHFFFSTA